MRSSVLRASIGALVVPAILAGGGCTGTDVLNPGNYELQFETTADEGATDFECVLWNINELRVQPVDGDCAGGLNDGDPCGADADCPDGSCAGALVIDTAEEFGVITESLNFVNFSDKGAPCEPLNTTAVDIPTLRLSTGRYRINALTLGGPTLVDSQGNSIGCGGFLEQVVPRLGDSVIFHIGEDEPNTINIVIDVEALAAVIDVPCDLDAVSAAIPSIVKIR
jgi:hypothetical protein